LMKFDLLSFGALLAEAIHGGPVMEKAQLSAWREAVGIGAPFQVVAIHHGAGVAPKLPKRQAGIALIQVHPGLAYLCTSVPLTRLRSTLTPKHLLVGESQFAGDETRLVPAIQQAIIALRRRELAAIGRRRGATLDRSAEHQARHLALQALRNDGDLNALRLWTDIVVLRHQASLNTVRRKAVELLADLTIDLDHASPLAYPFRSAIDRLYATFALSELSEVIPSLVASMATVVRGIESHPAPSEPLVQRARDLLRQRCTEMVSIAGIAAELGVSAAHLARRFRASTKQTPVAFLTSVRIERAREQLRESDDGILTIALDCGFGSLEHFHRTFRAATGQAPGAWRKAMRRS
jgi:AraC-like DNA-binding protein